MNTSRLIGFSGAFVALASCSTLTSAPRSYYGNYATPDHHDREVRSFAQTEYGHEAAAPRLASQADRRPAAAGGTVTLVGNVPTRYLTGSGTGAKLAQVVIDRGIISAVTAIQESDIPDGAIVLKNKTSKKYDTLYPGLINLHNHTKQNNLTVWGEAKGQFENRFEWRDWPNYQFAVSQNMNPWIQYGKPVECAAFRWSELSALVLGTTYLQGPSDCVSNFGINRVEDVDTFAVDKGVTPKLGVQAPTDIVYPDEMDWIYKEVRPLMKPGMTYGKAITQVLNKYCPALGIADANSPEALKKFNTMKAAEFAAKCTNPPKFLPRYFTFIHSSVVGKIAYLDKPNRAGIIAHLSEGSRNDPYNRAEFELLKTIGLDKPGFNLVHGVGIDSAGYKHMAKKGMGLVWSPFSNLLLYGETADVKAAKTAGVTIALGSDWTPTGSKSVLEELQIARQYVKNEKLTKIITDEELYKMVTENPAKLLGHFEEKDGDGYHDIGTLAKDAMGSVIAVTSNAANVYTNLVTADSKDINLVVVDGNVKYGNESYLEQLAKNQGKDLDALGVEEMPLHLEGLSGIRVNEVDAAPPKGSPAEVNAKHLVKLAKSPALKNLKTLDLCKFKERKYLVSQKSDEPAVVEFERDTGLNLDRYEDIQKLLGINVMTQGLNAQGMEGAKPASSPTYFAPLFSCNDPIYQERLKNFVAGKNEVKKNRAERAQRRKDQKLGKGPTGLANAYGLTPSGI